MQSYKYYYLVSQQTVFTYAFHHAKLQILQHGVTANSLYLSFAPFKVTNITTWCHCKQSLLILCTIQSYKYYYMVSQQTVFTYAFHHAKLQILLLGVTANSLYLCFSPCKATNITTCVTANSLYLCFSPCKATNITTCVTANSLYLCFSPCKATNITTCVTANSLYLCFSPCKATNITTWCHSKQSLLILFTMQSYKYYLGQVIFPKMG